MRPTPEEFRKQRARDYLHVFSISEGERVLEDMRKSFGDKPTYQPGQDALEMAWREGQRNVYLRIKQLMEWAREGFPDNQATYAEEESE